MRLRNKILIGTTGLIIAALGSLAVLISHTVACAPPAGAALEGKGMKAVTYRCYGPPEVLEFADEAIPEPMADEVLVNVHAAGVNPLDWHFMRGKPYLMRLMSGLGKPKQTGLGVDFSGTVTAVGRDVTRFRVGDEVFGGANGAFAQYLVIGQDKGLTIKPANVSFEQAAAVPIAAITALQAIRDKGQLTAGQSVLVNGASGGVGTYAVQIARAYGAQVTGVCSTRNVDMVRSLGADHVIDYTRQDYLDSDQRYDLIIDMVGNHSPWQIRSVLKPQGRLVMVGGPTGDWLIPLLPPIQAAVLSAATSQTFASLMAQLKTADLTTLAELMASGALTSVIDRRYPLSRVPEAMQYIEAGHARGKVIINTLAVP